MSTSSLSIYNERPDHSPRMRAQANAIYNEVCAKAFFARLIGRAIGKRREMPSLASRLAKGALEGQCAVGLRTVELDKIVGTESRADDFDAKFSPLNDRSRERWVSIATLRLSDRGLPAVILLQVGEEYFVRDGHHRISVARALGEAFIEAHVIKIELQ